MCYIPPFHFSFFFPSISIFLSRDVGWFSKEGKNCSWMDDELGAFMGFINDLRFINGLGLGSGFIIVLVLVLVLVTVIDDMLGNQEGERSSRRGSGKKRWEKDRTRRQKRGKIGESEHTKKKERQFQERRKERWCFHHHHHHHHLIHLGR